MVVTSLARAERTSVTRHFTAAAPLRCLVACIVAGALAVAGCSAGTRPQPHGGGSAQVALKFQVKGDAGGHGKPKTLTCDPAGGSQPAAASACSVLLKRKKNPFAPIAKEMNCPMLLRSNKKILVTGTWFGATVHRLVVDGGCDIALFDSLNKIGLTS
jgi:hypothetical protein